MKKILLISVFSLTFIFISLAQQVTISFKPKNDADKIDSVHVINLTKGQSVKLDAEEAVVFTSVTSVNNTVLDEIQNGYLYPNPFNDYITLTFNTQKNQKVKIAIYSVSGQLIYNQTQNLSPGNHSFQLHLPTSGLYHVIVLGNNDPLNYKAVYTGKTQQKVNIQYAGSQELVNNKNQSNQLKSTQNEKVLDYSEGDVVHYTVYSGDHITVIADAPTASKTLEVEFYECKDPDNRSYKIVQIGEQWWMAENLAYLPAVYPTSSKSFSESRYYVYGYYGGSDVEAAKKKANFKSYGALYNWHAAMNGAGSSTANPSGIKGVCPEGWHLPGDEEWTQLVNYLTASGYNYDGTTSANKIAKSLATTTDHWVGSNYPGAVGNDLFSNNSSGFSGLPGGYLEYNGFDRLGYRGFWWSTSEYGTEDAKCQYLDRDESRFTKYSHLKEFGLSVRCVKD